MSYSLATTTYNDEKEIGKFLENIFCQSKMPQEIVVADGGSTDRTIDILKDYQQKSPVDIKIIQGKRLNIAEGFNEAVKNSICEYIGIAGVGNYYDENYFEELIRIIQNNEADMTCGILNGYISNFFSECYTNVFLNKTGKITDTPTNHGCMLKKEIFKKAGFFYPYFVYAGEDEEYYNMLLQKGYKYVPSLKTQVYWKVPVSYKEFFKQINNYVIGSMQIHSWVKYIWQSKISFGLVISSVAILFHPAFLIIDLFAFLSWWVKYKNINSAVMKFLYHMARGLDSIKNVKYFWRNKVRRES